MDWLRNLYGDWGARYAEGFFVYGAFSSGLTSLWIIQNILEKSYNMKVSLLWIGLIFVVLFSITVFAMDKLGFIEARNNAVAKRNQYFRKIK